jgi:uncharacterized protein YxjI
MASSLLSRQTFFIRERVGFLKFADVYDILDPESKEQIGVAKEQPEIWVHLLRFLLNKKMLPTKVVAFEGTDPKDESRPVFSIHRGFTLLRSQIQVKDAQGNDLGYFKSKLFSLGGAFYVHDQAGNQVAMVQGDWKGWNFKFTDQSGAEIGSITKKWAGIGKELFTSADNYMISLPSGGSPERATLLLAAGLAIDTVYKEKN